MAIDQLTQTISTIPEAGHRGIDVQTAFVIKQEDFQDHLQGITVAELNTLKTQINITVSGMNDAVTTINTKANEVSANTLSASTSANTATTKASEATTSASNANAYSLKAGKWADNDYNVEVETGKYSAKHWSVVAQNTVNNKVNKVASTDNAVVRFDGTTGEVQNSSILINDNGNLNLSGVGARITGDFSNTTLANRVAFQSSIVNGNTGVSFIPNGTSRNAGSRWFNNSDISNAESLALGAASTEVTFISDKHGTGTYLPMIFVTGGSESMIIDTAGNVGIGTGRYTGYGRLGVVGQLGVSCSNLDAISARGVQFFIDGIKHGNLSVDNYDNLLYIGKGIGYGTGSGGTVTQLTSKSTSVTLNKPCGSITMNNAALAAGATVVFQVNNAIVNNADNIFLTNNYNETYSFRVSDVNYGNFRVAVKNETAASLSDTVLFNFTIIKGAEA